MRRSGASKPDQKPSLLPSPQPQRSKSLLDLSLMANSQKKSKTKSRFFSLKPTPIQPSSKTSLAPALVVPLSSACSDASASTFSTASVTKQHTVDLDDARSTLTSIPASTTSSSTIASKFLSFLRVAKGKSRKSEGNKGSHQGLMEGDVPVRNVATIDIDGQRSATPSQRSFSVPRSGGWRSRFTQGGSPSRSASSYTTPSPISISRRPSLPQPVCINDDDDDDDEEEDEEEEDDDDDDDDDSFRHLRVTHPQLASTPNPAAPGPASFMLFPPSPTRSQPPAQPKDRPTPRSHVQLTQLTLASLQAPASPHPLVFPHQANLASNSILFPRSCNMHSQLPTSPSHLSSLHKNRIIQRLERNSLTAAEELSIMPFATGRVNGTRPMEMQSRSGYHPSIARSILLRGPLGEEDSLRRADISPTARGTGPSLQSRGARRWLQRPSFALRAVEWTGDPDSGYVWTTILQATQLSIAYHPQPLQFSKGLCALAGLSHSSLKSLGKVDGSAHLPHLLIPPVPSLSSSPSPSGATSTTPSTPKSNRGQPVGTHRLKVVDLSTDDDDVPLGVRRIPSQDDGQATEEQKRKEMEWERTRREKTRSAEKEAKQKKQFAEQIAAARMRRETNRSGPRPPSMSSLTLLAETERKSDTKARTHLPHKSIAGSSPGKSSRDPRTQSRPISLVGYPQPGMISPLDLFPPVHPAHQAYVGQEYLFPPVPNPYFAHSSSSRSHSPASSIRRPPSRSESRGRRTSLYSEHGELEKPMLDDGISFRSLPKSFAASPKPFVVPPLPPLPPSFFAMQTNNQTPVISEIEAKALLANSLYSQATLPSNPSLRGDRSDYSTASRKPRSLRSQTLPRPRTMIT